MAHHRGGHDAQVKVASAQYAQWTADLPAALRDAMADAWGPAPGWLFVNDDGDLVLAALRSGNIVLMIQPPRGFGENPVAIYHDPDLRLAQPSLSRGVSMARARFRRPRGGAPRQARLDGVAAGQERCAVGVVRRRAG